MSQFPPPPGPEGQQPPGGGQQPPGPPPPPPGPPGGTPPPPPPGPPGGTPPPPPPGPPGGGTPPPPPPGPPGGTPPPPPPGPPGGGAAPPPPPPPPPQGPPGGYPPGPPPGGGYPGGGYPQGGAPGQRPFSVGDAFGYGWKKFTENVGPILIAMLVFFLIGAVIYGLQFLVQSVTSPETTVVSGENGFVVQQSGSGFLGLLVSLLFSVIGFVWNYLVQAAVARGGLAVTEGRPVVLGELLSLEKLGRIILAGIILGLLTLVGLLLCILPGLIVAFFGSYFVYFILDQDAGAWDSIKASFSFVKDNLGSLLLLFILSVIAIFVGALLCGIGLLVAYPVVFIAHAYAYKVLRGQPVAP